MTINVQAWSSSGDDGLEHGGNLLWGAYPTNMKLYQGDTLIHENLWSVGDMQWIEVPAGKLPYRLVLDASRPAEEFRLSTRTHTEWDFMSDPTRRTTSCRLALMQLDYSLPTDLRGDVKAGSTQQIGLTPVAAMGGSGIGNVTTVTLEVSYDDGATWQTVTLTKADGRWSANAQAERSRGRLHVAARGRVHRRRLGHQAGGHPGLRPVDDPLKTSRPRGAALPGAVSSRPCRGSRRRWEVAGCSPCLGSPRRRRPCTG